MEQASLFGEAKEVVLISRCFLGVPCRYHGKTTCWTGKPIGRPGLVARLRKRYTLLDVCPEVDGGLPVPRPQPGPRRRRGQVT